MAGSLASELPQPDVVRFFKALADETRLAILRLVMLSDLRAGEVVQRLDLPPNAASYHLKQLRSLGLLRDRRSSLDARDVYYSLDHARLHALYTAAGGALHPALAPDVDSGSETPRLDRRLRVLFLCTHNSARSQIAEAITRYLAGDQVEVFSAGSNPTRLHPMSRKVLEDIGIDSSSYHSKSMDRFLDQAFDYVITVCDRAQDVCPTFPDDPLEIHWSLPDPAAVEDDQARWKAFCRTRNELETRIRYLLNLPHPASGQRLKIKLRAESQREQA